MVGLTVLITSLAAAEARATCMEVARIRPILSDCTVLKEAQETGPRVDSQGRPIAPPTIEIWPASEPLALTVEVGGCCSPPGGPVSCSYRPVAATDATDFSLLARDPQGAQQPVEGSFRGESLACLGQTVLVFERPVPPGSYIVQTRHGGGSMVQIADDERAARATRVPAKVEATPNHTEATKTPDATATGGAAPTPNPPGCNLGGQAGAFALVVLASLVRRRRRG